MMLTKIEPRRVLPAALAVVAIAVMPGSAAASCAGARSNLAFIQQKIGAIRAEARAASANEPAEGTRQELARWAAVMPRAEREVAQQCATTAAAQRQTQPTLGPPQPGAAHQPPPLIATPVLNPPPASQPMRATPTPTVARPIAPPGTAPALAAVAVRVPGVPVDPRAGERSMRAKLNPAQDITAGAAAISTAQTAHPHTASDAIPNQSRIPTEPSVKHDQTLLQHTTGTAVRKRARPAPRKQAAAGTTPQQSFARPIFKTKN